MYEYKNAVLETGRKKGKCPSELRGAKKVKGYRAEISRDKAGNKV